MQNMTARPRRAFTLIELLVVIAIIAILASILFPVFARARENARRASCQSNMKQVGLGLIQYSQDFDERVPRSWFGIDNDASGVGRYKWMDAIYPYVKSEQIFNCPSDMMGPDNRSDISKASRYKYHDGATSYGMGYSYGSYGANNTYYDVGPDAMPPFSRDARLSTIAAPATTVWIGETKPITSANAAYHTFEFNWGTRTDDPSAITTVNGVPVLNSTPTYDVAIAARHLETTNVLYCDGHVKAVKLDALRKANAFDYQSAFTANDD